MSNPTLILLIGCGFFAMVQLMYYFFVFSKFAFHRSNSTESGGMVPVSVILTSKNELRFIKENLDLYLRQDYPEFEIIIINDGSWDGTDEYLEEISKSEPKLKVVSINQDEKYAKNKKFALTMGIKASQYEWLLFSNIDAVPKGNRWILEMSKGMTDDKEMVLGYSGYKKKNSILNLLLHWDSVVTAMRSFSYALRNKAFMSAGSNIAYKKSLFFSVKGFASHQHIIAGEEDLFINETANKTNTTIVYTGESFTTSLKEFGWKQWFRLNRSKVFVQKFLRKRFDLYLLNMGQLFFYLFLMAGLIFSFENWPYFLGIFLFKTLCQYIILYNIMKKLEATRLLAFSWLLDILMLPYYLTLGISGMVTKKIKNL
ncbi:MAG: glycosyltransferase [Flavobacteriales bacterium]|nr:glycosyltransferase [Flavobacteriales bacterium]